MTNYTPEMIEELKRCVDDPVYFISNYCYIENPSTGKILFKLYDFQEKIIRSFQENRYSILLQGRQTGKTDMIAAYALWFAMFHSDQSIMLGAQKEASATDILRRVKLMYENLPDYMKAKALYNNRQSMEFDNGSRIRAHSINEYMGRGMAINLLMLDELAFVKKDIIEEFWASVWPTICCSKHSKMIIASTPNWHENGKFFEKLWTEAVKKVNCFVPIFVQATMPGRGEDWEHNMKQLVGEKRFKQEYAAEFQDKCSY